MRYPFHIWRHEMEQCRGRKPHRVAHPANLASLAERMIRRDERGEPLPLQLDEDLLMFATAHTGCHLYDMTIVREDRR